MFCIRLCEHVEETVVRRTITITVVSVLLFFESTAFANTYYVPENFSAIQAALDAAVNGDTIIVCDGTYTGAGNKNLDFNGKALTLRSESGPHNCIIDCIGSGSGFFFRGEQDAASVVDGFTILNGGASGIVFESHASPIIMNCIITGNSGNPNGGGIYCAPNASPTLVNCTITGNSARYGGGIFCDYAEPSVTNCILWGNSALLGEEIYLANASSITIRYSNIHGGQSAAYVERSCLLNWGDGIIEAEPLFLDEVNADYHLTPSSPCIDTGDPVSDYSRELTPDGDVVNMGAYGNTAEAATAIGLAEEGEEPDHDHDDDTNFLCLFRSSLQGSPFEDKLDIIRRFRDRFLVPTFLGKPLVKFYYRTSPPVSRFVHSRKPVLVITKATLISIVWACEIIMRPPEQILGLTGLCACSALLTITILTKRKRSRKKASLSSD
jgi:hypothetical protein